MEVFNCQGFSSGSIAGYGGSLTFFIIVGRTWEYACTLPHLVHLQDLGFKTRRSDQPFALKSLSRRWTVLTGPAF